MNALRPALQKASSSTFLGRDRMKICVRLINPLIIILNKMSGNIWTKLIVFYCSQFATYIIVFHFLRCSLFSSAKLVSFVCLKKVADSDTLLKISRVFISRMQNYDFFKYPDSKHYFVPWKRLANSYLSERFCMRWQQMISTGASFLQHRCKNL
jgi:hypothetical protein